MLSVRRHGPLILLLVGILLVLVGCRSEPPARIVGFPQYEGAGEEHSIYSALAS